jgi:hypothetical protein
MAKSANPDALAMTEELMQWKLKCVRQEKKVRALRTRLAAMSGFVKALCQCLDDHNIKLTHQYQGYGFPKTLIDIRTLADTAAAIAAIEKAEAMDEDTRYG